MTQEELFAKADALKITRSELASAAGLFPHTLTNFRDGKIEMSQNDAFRLSGICDEIVARRHNVAQRGEVIAA